MLRYTGGCRSNLLSPSFDHSPASSNIDEIPPSMLKEQFISLYVTSVFDKLAFL